MTDQEINRRLALAIGWSKKDMRIDCGLLFLPGFTLGVKRLFYYRYWDIAAPIAERYDCFPWKDEGGKWGTYPPGYLSPPIYADTPQEAIALAVIAAHKAGLLK